MVANLEPATTAESKQSTDRRETSRFAAISGGMRPTLINSTTPTTPAVQALERGIEAVERQLEELHVLLTAVKEEMSSVPRNAPPPRLLTVHEAASVLSIGTSTVNTLIRTGGIGSVKIGSARRVPIEAIDQFLRSTVEDQPA